MNLLLSTTWNRSLQTYSPTQKYFLYAGIPPIHDLPLNVHFYHINQRFSAPLSFRVACNVMDSKGDESATLLTFRTQIKYGEVMVSYAGNKSVGRYFTLYDKSS